MPTIIRCADLGFDCDGVVRAETEEDALRQVADHARDVHGIETVPPAVIAQARAAMRHEPPAGEAGASGPPAGR